MSTKLFRAFFAISLFAFILLLLLLCFIYFVFTFIIFDFILYFRLRNCAFLTQCNFLIDMDYETINEYGLCEGILILYGDFLAYWKYDLLYRAQAQSYLRV